jgi:hypothetical protein
MNRYILGSAAILIFVGIGWYAMPKHTLANPLSTAPTATIATAAVRQLGFFGHGPTDIASFETWLGRGVEYTVVFGGHDNGWADFNGSIWYITDVWKSMPGRKLMWSVPLIVKHWPDPPIATLAKAAAGKYDAYYQNAAYDIAARDPKAIIRIGWEFNGDWYPWAASADEQGYIGAFRDMVKVFRSVSPDFVFMWCPNIGSPNSDPALAYPGNDVVDIIGMDIYENSKWDTGTPDERWSRFLTRDGRGLDWLASFAAEHGKPIAMPEWATNYDDGSFIRHMHDWMSQHHVLMQSYWDSDASFNGSFETHPANGALYKELFRSW